MKNLLKHKKLLIFALVLFVAVVFRFTSIGFGSLSASLTDTFSGSPEDNREIIEYVVQGGDTFGSIMERLGLSSDVANRLLREAEKEYDFTRITAGQPFRFIFDERQDSEKMFLSSIEYDIDNEEIVIVSSTANGLNIERSDIEYETELVEAGATINSSLFVDASDAGISAKTILELAEIFAWDIDFTADIREGDSFKIVYRDLYRGGEFVGPGRILAAKFVNKGDTFRAFYFENDEIDGRYFTEDGSSVAKQFLKSPLRYARISSGFSYNRLNPVTRSSYGPHRAIDYAAPPGTPVYATGDGTVAYAGWGSGLGRHVKIRHGGVYDTVYAHFSSIARGISSGARVAQNQVVGYVGSTGYATGPHLHYEMHKYGRRVNPLTVELPEGKSLPEKYDADFQRVVDKFKTTLQ